MKEIITDDANEYCWKTGHYTTSCDCGMCSHQDECSGSNTDEDDLKQAVKKTALFISQKSIHNYYNDNVSFDKSVQV